MYSALTCNINSESLIHLKTQRCKWSDTVETRSLVSMSGNNRDTWWKCCSTMMWRSPEEFTVISLAVKPGTNTITQMEQTSYVGGCWSGGGVRISSNPTHRRTGHEVRGETESELLVSATHTPLWTVGYKTFVLSFAFFWPHLVPRLQAYCKNISE